MSSLLFILRVFFGFIAAVSWLLCFITPTSTQFGYALVASLVYAAGAYLDWRYQVPQDDAPPSSVLAAEEELDHLLKQPDSPLYAEHDNLGHFRARRFLPDDSPTRPGE